MPEFQFSGENLSGMEAFLNEPLYSVLFLLIGCICLLLEVFIPSGGILGFLAVFSSGWGIVGFFAQGSFVLGAGSIVGLSHIHI